MTIREINRLKNRTRARSRRLIKLGLLRNGAACEKCGDSPPSAVSSNGRPKSWIEMHHPDYRDPERIIWLCLGCHFSIHGKKLRSKPYIDDGGMWAHNAYGKGGPTTS